MTHESPRCRAMTESASPWLPSVIDATVSPTLSSPEASKASPPPLVTINRHRAAKERPDRRAKMRHSVFMQLLVELAPHKRAALRRRERSFKVKFTGEAADDYGGPYREARPRCDARPR